jgi:hypothetical protein
MSGSHRCSNIRDTGTSYIGLSAEHLEGGQKIRSQYRDERRTAVGMGRL